MAAMRRLYVDANIFIRVFEYNNALAVELGELFLMASPGPQPFLVTTLLELLCGPFRDGDDDLIDVYDGWTASNERLEVGPIVRRVLWDAAVLRSQDPSLKTPDAIHVATAIGSGCSHFLSFDRGIRNRYELSHQKQGYIRGRATLEIVRPEAATIRNFVEAAKR